MKIFSEKLGQFIFAAFTIGLPLGCCATIPMGTWVEEAPYPVSNYTVGSATVNGSIYVFGVDGTTTISTTEIYNPTTNTWTSAPGMPTPRAVSGAAAVGTVIYVVGGQTNVAEVATVEALDTLTNTWSTATPMPQPLERMAVVSANGYLYTLGGCLTFTCGGSDTNLVQQFDPVTQMWTVKSSMSTPGVTTR